MRSAASLSRRWSVLTCAALAAGVIATVDTRAASRRVTWSDLGPAAALIRARGLERDAFPAYVARTHDENVRRVREGDLDHLVFYVLQSTHRVDRPPIEPALSAKAFVDALTADERKAFFETSTAPLTRIPSDVRSRAEAVVRTFDARDADPRLAYVRQVAATLPPGRERLQAVLREYVRAMRFVYEKEVTARQSSDAAAVVARLYKARGLSTDTAVEAGYLVYQGLGVARSLTTGRPVRRVLIVGPGLDLAPRTGLVEVGPPESYQPWAVMDALIALGLAKAGDLEVVAADINPRVVSHIRNAAAHPPALTLATELRERDGLTLSSGYRDYFDQLGRAIGDPDTRHPRDASRLVKVVRIRADAARHLSAEPLDIVTERLDGAPFDLAVATNILPYFDDTQLTLALSNIASMLAPGGVFLHNEPRPALGEITERLGLRFEQSRHAVIATVKNAPAPLGDSVFLHVKR